MGFRDPQGQLLFIATVGLAWWIIRRIQWPAWARRIPVYGIGSMATYWTIDRVAGILY
jgi:hypothetical protein